MPLETMIGRVLGTGVAISTALLAAGLLLALAAPGRASAWLLQAGLVLLMVTPATRVVLACVEFTRTREWAFAIVSLGVLAVLGAAMWVAFLG